MAQRQSVNGHLIIPGDPFSELAGGCIPEIFEMVSIAGQNGHIMTPRCEAIADFPPISFGTSLDRVIARCQVQNAHIALVIGDSGGLASRWLALPP